MPSGPGTKNCLDDGIAAFRSGVAEQDPLPLHFAHEFYRLPPGAKRNEEALLPTSLIRIVRVTPEPPRPSRGASPQRGDTPGTSRSQAGEACSTRYWRGCPSAFSRSARASFR